jgi:hypothetical protein
MHFERETMSDEQFLQAMRIKNEDAGRAWLGEALRIDDVRSEYCERLENLIAQQASEIEELRWKYRALLHDRSRRA